MEQSEAGRVLFELQVRFTERIAIANCLSDLPDLMNLVLIKVCFRNLFLRYFIKIAKNLHHSPRGRLPLTKALNTKVGSNFFLLLQLHERLMLSLYGSVFALILKI